MPLYHLEALGGQGPEEGAGADLVGLDQVVVYETLVDVLDRLQDDALLGAPPLKLLQVQDLFLKNDDVKQ